MVELKVDFDRVKKLFINLPDQLADLPTMNPSVFMQIIMCVLQRSLCMDLIMTTRWRITLLHCSTSFMNSPETISCERYPDSCLNFQYDANFPIRGLYYDKKMGYLLKLDFFHSVQPGGCFFGQHRLDEDDLEATYHGKHVSSEHMRYLIPLMDLFCLSEVCVLADVIQQFMDQKLDFNCTYVYEDV